MLIDEYIKGLEVEVDAISDGKDILIPGIMEHIERAGIHSGDSLAVYPRVNLSKKSSNIIEEYSIKIAKGLNVKGLINIQYIVTENDVYVLEVNPRSSRTVPFLSKVTGIPMVELATRVSLGAKLNELGFGTGLAKESKYVAVKAPVFSFDKLFNVDISLGPEMKSTGEVMGIGRDLNSALYKAILASGIDISPKDGGVIMTIADGDKKESLDLARGFSRLGFDIFATLGTAKFFRDHGINCNKVYKLNSGKPDVIECIQNMKASLVINTVTQGKRPERDGFKIRRSASEQNIPCLTSLDTARAVLESMSNKREKEVFSIGEIIKETCNR